MRTYLSKYDNSSYSRGAGKTKCLLWYFANLLFIKNHWNPLNGLKVGILKLFGSKIGKGVIIKPGVNIKYPWLLTIGDYSWIGEDVWIDNLAQVTIGLNCCISQGALLLCGNHNFRSETFDLIVKPITIEDGAWVGAKSVVCPGVTVKEDAIITVGSVATKSLDAATIYQGNPAVSKRKR